MLKYEIRLAEPIINQEMVDAAIHALKHEQLLRGNSVKEFEDEFAKIIGCRYAVAVNNGSMALQISLLASGIKKNDIVATTPASFIATANAIMHINAKPLFIDISLDDYNLDPSKLEQALRKYDIKAVLLVHLYGNPADMDYILSLKDSTRFILLEDACQAHGACYNSKPIGSFGEAAAFSFYPSKNITVAGDGGMITSDDPKIAKVARIARDVGRYNGKHVMLGYTARLNTINAAIGKVQLKYLNQWLDKRHKLAMHYIDRLKNLDIILPKDYDNRKHAWHIFAIRHKKRDLLKEYLALKGIETKIHYPLPIHLEKPYRMLGYREGMLPNAERWSKTILSLPLHPNLTFEQVDYVIDSIKEFLERN